MLRDRLWAGTLLVVAGAGVLVVDERAGRWHPALLLLTLAFGVLACGEYRRLVAHAGAVPPAVFTAAVLFVLLTPWLAGVVDTDLSRYFGVTTTALAFALALFWLAQREVAGYAGPGGVVARLALAGFGVAYLGLLPSFLLHLRWLDVGGAYSTAWLLALVVAVPKSCDIGAYAAGRLVGRTPLHPRLSPKKTVEGTLGGLALGVVTAACIQAVVPIFPGGYAEAAWFGLMVGMVAVEGDLVESIIKRDAGAKDASATVPGFGGVLDVLDSILFAAPVGWLWLSSRAGVGGS